MKAITYLRKFYDVIEITADSEDGKADGLVAGEVHYDVFEKGEDCENIGTLVHFEGTDTYQWRRIYGKVESGTAFTGETLKTAAKLRVFG
jgi:hypothetical protein